MELREFIRNVLVQVNQAVDEARNETKRNISFSEKDSVRTIEFDIAVSAENSDSASGKAGIKVLQFAEAGGDIKQENKNSTVSRITFGLRINPMTRDEEQEQQEEIRKLNSQARTFGN